MANVFVAVAILCVFVILAGRARVICLVKGARTMNIEDELKHKAYYIEFFAKMVTDHAESLEEYSGWLLNRTKQIQTEMEMLREQNKKLKEALKFYADESHYLKDCIDSRAGTVEEVIIDNGRIARNTLEECGL